MGGDGEGTAASDSAAAFSVSSDFPSSDLRLESFSGGDEETSTLDSWFLEDCLVLEKRELLKVVLAKSSQTPSYFFGNEMLGATSSSALGLGRLLK